MEFCFSWKDGSGISAGSSAQYWGEVLPWLITERDKYLEMAYSNIALINTIATARTVLDHESRIRELEKENMELKERLSVMERRVA